VAIELLPKGTISVGAKRLLDIDCRNELPDGVDLAAPLTITEATGDLAITDDGITSEALEILDENVEAGRAIRCLIDATGATEGIVYVIEIKCATDSSPAELLAYEYHLEAV